MQIIKLIHCYLQHVFVSDKMAEKAPNCMSSLKTIPGIIPLNHVLANLSKYASIKSYIVVMCNLFNKNNSKF